MRAENIMVSLHNSSESGNVLVKYLPDNYLQKDFGDLLNYMADHRGDNINEAYETRENIHFAKRVQGWINKVKFDPETSSLDLRYMKENGTHSQPISLDERVGDSIGNMILSKENIGEDGPIPYEGLDLYVQYHGAGGA